MWSCGVVLFVMLFGCHPFLSSEDTQLRKHAQVGLLLPLQSCAHACALAAPPPLPWLALFAPPSLLGLAGAAWETRPLAVPLTCYPGPPHRQQLRFPAEFPLPDLPTQVMKLIENAVRGQVQVPPGAAEQHPGALDLVRRILVSSPQQRCKLPAVMAHPWFQVR